MRIAMGVGGEVTGAPMSPQDIVEDVVRAEADGFGSAWSAHFSRGVDALDVLAVAGARTSRIDLGVGIVPTYPRHPLALAQQAATTQAFCGGRLTLGVGVPHRPVIEDLHGITYARPAAKQGVGGDGAWGEQLSACSAPVMGRPAGSSSPTWTSRQA
jgi:5,10-methylenetetrahydromethanopterin reductase